MTRGNFLLITDTANWMSSQFNGDMKDCLPYAGICKKL